jgi:NAD(P)-dependent dehydrogenase (short-subunit alcohol dehydrogenase family)
MNNNKKTGVVVGATGAFGQAIISKLLKEGLHVIAVARTASALADLENQYPGIGTCVADISDDSSIDAIHNVVNGPVQMVVHGPGVGVAGGIMDAPTATMVDAVNIKVGGFMRLCRAVDEYLEPHSRLVAIAGHYGLEPTAYAASAGVANAALFNVVRQISLALGPRGITAHTIAPGPADTERLHRVAQARADMRGISLLQVLDEMKADSSINAFTTPQQVAWAVSTLLAEEADSMTGSTLMLDSGRRRGLP